MKIKSYLKWAGSKYKIISKIIKYFPQEFNDYYEPFVGSASVFLNILNLADYLSTRKYYLSDNNDRLINCHNNIANNSSLLIKKLKDLENQEKNNVIFDIIKDRFNSNKYIDTIQESIDFIYLNKRCYGGLYRLNNKGEFNSPFDPLQKSSLTKAITNCVYPFKKGSFSCLDYKNIKPKKNDFIFLDPPYYPRNKTSNFVGYGKIKWKDKEHLELVDYVNDLNNSGIKFVMTNSNTEFILQNYSNYRIDKIQVQRYIDALTYYNINKKENREKIDELIIRNF